MAIPSNINTSQRDATLVVAWRSGKIAACRVVRTDREIITGLLEHAEKILQIVRNREGRAYDPDDAHSDDNGYLSASQEELLDTALLAQIKRGDDLPPITLDELGTKRLALYALLVGDNADTRLVFIRKGSPVSLTTRSLVGIFDQRLERVTNPILSFDSTFDLILYGNDAWIFNQANFEGLFKESAAVLAKTAQWVDELSQFLPIAGGGKDYLANRLRRNSLMRRKVHSITTSSYLPMLTPEILAKKMAEHNLDPEKLLIDGKLVFTSETETDMLLLLNEDLWAGDFSGDQYAATDKERH